MSSRSLFAEEMRGLLREDDNDKSTQTCEAIQGARRWRQTGHIYTVSSILDFQNFVADIQVDIAWR